MAADPMALPASVAIGVEATPTRTALRSAALGSAARYEAIKRLLDVTVALLMLLGLMPVFALVALAIWVEDRGPAFYRADRVGRFGKTFRVVKFRSMRAGCATAAHAAFVRSLMRDGERCAMYKVPNDTRITRVGTFLRRTSLDELPQLWNVLRGDMSLVGPRPDVLYAFAEYSDWIHRRLLVRPGLTGLWQVSGRSRLGLMRMYELDVRYAAQASLRLDLEILLRTVPAVLGRDGAA